MAALPSATPQTLSDRATSDLLQFAEDTVRNGFSELGRAGSDLPGFLAGPLPSSPAALPLYGITRAACRSYARGNGLQNSPAFDGAWSGLCSPYLDGIGEGVTPGLLDLPFLGGQCPVSYRFRWQQRTFTGGAWAWSTTRINTAVGPLSIGKPGDRAPFTCTGVASFDGYAALFDGTGERVTILANGCTDVPNGWRLISIEPVVAAPDNCGNPNPRFDPPNITPGLPPLAPSPVTFPGIGPVNVDVTFGPDGEIIVSFPDLGIDTTIANPFESGGGGEPGQNPPGFQGNPGDSQDVGEGGAAEGEDENRTLLGVLVQTISYPPRVNRLFNPTESYTKGAYYVYLGGNAGLVLVDTAAITRPDQFYPAPEGSNRFRVVPNSGFTIRVTPFYDEE